MMRAVDAVMECLKAEGVDVVFGYPGGANLPTYDAFVDAGIRHILVRHEAGGGHAAEGYAKASGKVGVGLRHLGPGRDEHRHAAHRRDDGLGADRRLHRPGAHRPARHGRLPGGGHVRHHDADRQALVHDPAPHGDPARRARGLPRRPHRPPRPGADRHAGGPHARGDRLRAGRRRAPARLPADHRGQLEADPDRRQGAGQRPPAGHLRRRRRHQRRRVGRADRAGHRRPLPGHLHADGPRRLPGSAPPVAGHARDARHAHGQLRDGRGRPDRRDRGALRRPDHRQAVGVRAAGEVRAHRHRPGGDLQERPRAHPDRGRREEHRRAARDRVPRAGGRPRAPERVVGAHRGLARPSTRCATTTRPTARSSRSS